MTNIVDIILKEQEGTESRVSNWLKSVGDKVEKNEPICDLETDKVNMEISAPASGILTEIRKNPGDKVDTDEVLGRISISDTGSVSATNDNKNPASIPAANTNQSLSSNLKDDSSLLSPAVKYLLRTHDLDYKKIKGTGRNQRITRSDVLLYLESPSNISASSEKTSISASTNPVVTPTAPAQTSTSFAVGATRRVPHSPMRRKIADHMVLSLLKEAPHVTSIFEADLTNIIEHRKWHKKEFAEEGANLTFTAYFLKASAIAMQEVPEVNSQFHKDFLEIFEDVNIGIGTALGDKGLVVPVIKNVEKQSLLQIAKNLTHLTGKARNNKITAEDLKGGTFTISNHGVSGSLVATPIIINQPQSAILGIGKLQKRVMVEEINGKDEIKIKPMAYITLSIDHRVLDAHQTNLFLSKFVETIENWGQ